MGSPNPDWGPAPSCSTSSINSITESTQLKPGQISCAGPTQEIWQTEHGRGKPHQHKIQDVHSIIRGRLTPLLPITAIINDRNTLSQKPWGDTRSPHGCRNRTGICVIAMLPGPTGLAAIEGEGPRPAPLFCGDNCLNPDAPQALSYLSHYHGGWVLSHLMASLLPS